MTNLIKSTAGSFTVNRSGQLHEESHDHGETAKGHARDGLESRSSAGAVWGRRSRDAARRAVMAHDRRRVGLLLAGHGARGRSRAAGDDGRVSGSRTSGSKDGVGLHRGAAKGISGRHHRDSRLRSAGINVRPGSGWNRLDDGSDRHGLSGRIDRGRVADGGLCNNYVGSSGERNLALGVLNDGAVVHGIHEDA